MYTLINLSFGIVGAPELTQIFLDFSLKRDAKFEGFLVCREKILPLHCLGSYHCHIRPLLKTEDLHYQSLFIYMIPLQMHE